VRAVSKIGSYAWAGLRGESAQCGLLCMELIKVPSPAWREFGPVSGVTALVSGSSHGPPAQAAVARGRANASSMGDWPMLWLHVSTPVLLVTSMIDLFEGSQVHRQAAVPWRQPKPPCASHGLGFWPGKILVRTAVTSTGPDRTGCPSREPAAARAAAAAPSDSTAGVHLQVP
jgi:hypothetical protein